MVSTVYAAVTIKRFINDVGDYVGFASIIAVAILILLYFSHARETSTLRERMDDAQNRIAGLEARIAQLIHAQSSAPRGPQPVPGRPAPVPSPVLPVGSAVASVRRVPTAAPAGVAAAAGAATATLARPAAGTTATPVNGFPPAAAAGLAAPALASATKLIPDPPLPQAPATTPDDTIFVPAAAAATAAAAANGRTDQKTTAMPVAAAASVTASAVARPPAGGPPRVQIGADGDPSAAPPRRTIPGRREVPPASPILPVDDESGRMGGRLFPLLIGGIAVIVIIVGLVLIINTGGSSTTNLANGGTGAQNSPTTGQSLSQHHHKALVFKPATVTVSILNGTAVANLAADVGKKLGTAGYKQGNVTNAASQTEPTTIVYYLPGASSKANKLAAQHVAKQLKLPPSSVHVATRGAISSCSTSVTGTVGNSCDANVIVSVGADRANLASSTG